MYRVTDMNWDDVKARLIIGVMARYGSERIRGHGIPEAIEAILINGSKVEPKVALPGRRVLVVLHPDLLLRILHDPKWGRRSVMAGYRSADATREEIPVRSAAWLLSSGVHTPLNPASIPVSPPEDHPVVSR